MLEAVLIPRTRLLALLFCLPPLQAHDVITTNLNFTRDVSRIFARRCAACHAEGSSIPLATYEEARPWAVSIKEQVLTRSMPPWGAVKGFGTLSPDHALSQEEIMIIAAWVIGGAPKGDPKLLPAAGASAKPIARPKVQDSVVIATRGELNRRIQAVGIRPLATEKIDSARIIARLPSGEVKPLVWLFHYDPKLDSAFTFRRALDLPTGTIIESSAPVRLAVETNAALMTRDSSPEQ